MKKKGMTLVEIIIAIAILGIISVAFLGSMLNHFVLLTKSKNITVDLFHTQKNVEKEMENIRAMLWTQGKTYNINDEIYIKGKKYKCKEKHISNIFANESGKWDEIPFDKTSYIVDDLFGESLIDINAFKIEKEYGTKKISTLIAQQKMEFEIPVITAFSSILKPADTSKTQNYTYGIKYSRIESTYTLDPTTQDVFKENFYQWYQSREGFNIKLPKKDKIIETEWREKYPGIPDDFEAIAGEDGQTIDDLQNYKGRHLIIRAKPSSKIGKPGKMVYTDPIFISALPIIDERLVLHLDASLIDIDDSNNVNDDGIDQHVLRWRDSSEKNDVVQSNTMNQPILKDIEFGELRKGSSVYPVYARVIRFDGMNDYFTLQKNSLGRTSLFCDKNQEFTIIVVAKANNISANQTFISKSSGWDDKTATYTFGRNRLGSFQQVIRGARGSEESSDRGNDNFNIHITQWDSSTHKYWINSHIKTNMSSIPNTANQTGKNIVIGAADSGSNSYLNGDIAEIIVYDKALTEAERKSIEEYLSKKYIIDIDR